MPKQVTTYSLEELKEQFPEAYERVHQRWADGVARSGDIAWQDEEIDSLKAVVSACNATLNDWSIGADDPRSYIRVSVPDDLEEMEDGGIRDWFLRQVLKPNGYTAANGHAQFPGVCAFTGYCADDGYLEHVWKEINNGESLKSALESLADVVSQHFQANLEQMQDEDSMLANWDGAQFMEDGTEV